MTEQSRTRLWVAFAGAMVVLVLASAFAPAVEAPAASAEGARAIGRAGFAYLGGLRTFAASVLWNRIDPQYHEYYEGEQLGEMTFMLPTIRLVQALDPQFQEAYYVGAWIVARHGDRPTGIQLAHEGIAANPKSGLLRANLITLLAYDETQSKNSGEHTAEMAAIAEEGLASDMQWNSLSDRFESFAVFAAALDTAGRTQRADAVREELDRMRASGVDPNAAAELEEKKGSY